LISKNGVARRYPGIKPEIARLWRKEDFAMEEPGLDQRHRDKNGEIARKHGDKLIATLRRIYGRGFAPGCGDHEKLSDVLRRMNEHSLSLLVHDHHRGELDGKIDKVGEAIRATWDTPPNHSEPNHR
jgi:hypothetical protein